MGKISKSIFSLIRSVLPEGYYNKEFISQSILVEETIPQKFIMYAGTTAAVAVILGIGFASVVTVAEKSTATGALIPSGFEQSVQHLEGGIVEKIHVKEGEIVSKGQKLISLRDASTVEDSETMDHQQFDLLAQIEVQNAFAENRAPDFSFIPLSYLNIKANSRQFYDASFERNESQKRELKNQIAQKRLAVDVVQTRLANLQREVSDAKIELERFNLLYEKGVATQIQLHEKSRFFSKSKSEAEIARKQRNLAHEQLTASEQALQSFLANMLASTRQKKIELEAKLIALTGNIKKKLRRQARLDITAPLSGIVKLISVKGNGEVVSPSQQLAIIVPKNASLEAETKVSASEIGYLKRGQKALIKISSYDFTRYGWLTAQVASISPSSFSSDKGESYYNVRLKLVDKNLKHAPGAPILPGMDITAEILTGKKTILQYLLTPLQRNFSSAFGER